MSFTKQINTSKKSSYPEYNVISDSVMEQVTATFDVKGIVSLFGNDGVAEYLVTIDGKQGSANRFPFTYSGSGNPIAEAEAALKQSV